MWDYDEDEHDRKLGLVKKVRINPEDLMQKGGHLIMQLTQTNPD